MNHWTDRIILNVAEAGEKILSMRGNRALHAMKTVWLAN